MRGTAVSLGLSLVMLTAISARGESTCCAVRTCSAPQPKIVVHCEEPEVVVRPCCDNNCAPQGCCPTNCCGNGCGWQPRWWRRQCCACCPQTAAAPMAIPLLLAPQAAMMPVMSAPVAMAPAYAAPAYAAPMAMAPVAAMPQWVAQAPMQAMHLQQPQQQQAPQNAAPQQAPTECSRSADLLQAIVNALDDGQAAPQGESKGGDTLAAPAPPPAVSLDERLNALEDRIGRLERDAKKIYESTTRVLEDHEGRIKALEAK